MTDEQMADIFWPIFKHRVAEMRDIDPEFVKLYDEQFVKDGILGYYPYRDVLHVMGLHSSEHTLYDVAVFAKRVLNELYKCYEMRKNR